MKRYFGKFRRDVKALSPIFAVLILIAIAVIAGIIVYMFTSGYLATMMGGGTAGQEKVAVEAVEVTATGVDIWAKSTGGGDVVITEAILRDASGSVLQVDEAAGGTLTKDGNIVKISATVTLAAGDTYTVAIVSEAGNQFVSPSFKGE